MPSPHYEALTSQISDLGAVLLPIDINQDILELPPDVSVKALSYRILCHAELENYFESRGLEIATAADKAWKERQHISRSTFCLLAFWDGTLEKLPDTLQAPPHKKRSDWDALIKPDSRLSRAITAYNRYIRSLNHGIKEENLISVLLPIGLNPDRIDPTLIADLNDLGIKRGEAAHTGISGHVRKGVNPRDEYSQIARIIGNLTQMDEQLNELLTAAL